MVRSFHVSLRLGVKQFSPGNSNFSSGFSLKVFCASDTLIANHSTMKKLPLLALTWFFTATSPLFAADALPAAVPSWHPQSLLQVIGNVLIFAGLGIAAAIIGYKVFDKCTPGDLQREIIEHKNIAAAIVAAAVIIGVSIIIAAAMLG